MRPQSQSGSSSSGLQSSSSVRREVNSLMQDGTIFKSLRLMLSTVRQSLRFASSAGRLTRQLSATDSVRNDVRLPIHCGRFLRRLPSDCKICKFSNFAIGSGSSVSLCPEGQAPPPTKVHAESVQLQEMEARRVGAEGGMSAKRSRRCHRQYFAQAFLVAPGGPSHASGG